MNPARAYEPEAIRPTLLGLLALFVAVGLLAYFGLMAPRDAARASPIWLANAPLLAVLLRAPAKQWWAWLAAAFLANLAADFYGAIAWRSGIALSLCNVAEATLAAWLLRRALPGPFDPAKPSHLPAAAAVSLLSAAVSAVAASGYLGLYGEGDPLQVLKFLGVWALADGLGLVLLTPCLLILMDWRRHLDERPISQIGLTPLVMLVAVECAVFAQSSLPLSFIVPTAIVIVAMTLEVFGAALAVMITTVVATSFTFQDIGPLSGGSSGWTTRLLVLQLFLVVNAALGLQIAALQRRQRRTREALIHAKADAEAQAARAHEVEMRYRLLADRATDIISLTDIDGRIIYVSPSVQTVTGYSAEELAGFSVNGSIHPSDITPFRRAYQELIDGVREPGTPVRYRIRHKQGHWIWIEGNPSPVRDEQGAVIEFVDVSRDVSEQVGLEESLEAARTEAELSARVKTEFLANMSHEIRTPLTSIVGFAGFLDELKLPDPAGRYVDRVVSASRTLLAIVNDILDFSKLEAGKLEIKARPCDAAQCARDVLELFHPQAEAKGVVLEFVAGRLPQRVMVDPDRLRQVLMNLAGNAVKFTQTGTVKVEVAYDNDTQRLKCKVSDTGPGLDKEARSKLFQRFSQVDGSMTRAHGGTGLGLAICKGLVDAMGGEIGVKSRKGKGATFWFDLPAPSARAPIVPTEENVDIAPLAGVRMLAVDDNPANLEILRSLLTPLGVELSEATGGAEAVEAANTAPYDLILMDLRMPGVDGWAAATAIRGGEGPNRDIPILAFSADVTVDRRGVEDAFDAMVRKPVEPMVLIREVLRWTSIEDQDLGESADVDAVG
jgi:PAS domain S-box-containing protein